MMFEEIWYDTDEIQLSILHFRLPVFNPSTVHINQTQSKINQTFSFMHHHDKLSRYDRKIAEFLWPMSRIVWQQKQDKFDITFRHILWSLVIANSVISNFF
jgi:hypothetical protein